MPLQYQRAFFPNNTRFHYQVPRFRCIHQNLVLIVRRSADTVFAEVIVVDAIMKTVTRKQSVLTLVVLASLSACGSGNSPSEQDSTNSNENAPGLGSAFPTTPQVESLSPSTANNTNSVNQITTQIDPQPTLVPTSVPEPEAEPDVEMPVELVTNAGCSAAQGSIQASTLHLINTARASARSCGGDFFEATGPLSWDSRLEAAAGVHSNDMALHNFFSHTGSDGSSASSRAEDQNYSWRMIGENIAAGQQTTEDVVNAWLDSPGHCANIMNPDFENMAVRCVENSGAQYVKYWTQMLGTTF